MCRVHRFFGKSRIPQRDRANVLGTVLLSGAFVFFSSEAFAESRHACASAAEEAQTLMGNGQLSAARVRLRECLRAECPPVVRTDCAEWLADVERKMPSIVVRARADGRDITIVDVYVDDALIGHRLDGRGIEVDPGVHTIRLEGAGYEPERIEVLALQGQKDRAVEASLKRSAPARPTTTANATPAPTPSHERPIPTLTLVLGGIGIAALGAFGYFETVAQIGYADLKSGCGATRTCPASEVDPLRTEFLTAGISLAAGAALLGAAALAWRFSTSAPSPAR